LKQVQFETSIAIGGLESCSQQLDEENEMGFLLGALIAVVIAVALFVSKARQPRRWRRRNRLFKPLTRPNGGVAGTLPPFGMRAAAPGFTRDEKAPRIGGRRRAGLVCFVTGMSRTRCSCADCQTRR
jgi:hypothetical protein